MSGYDAARERVERRGNKAPRPRVMAVLKEFPDRFSQGNLTYLDAIVSFLEQLDIELQLVVLGDRLPNNHFLYGDAARPNRMRRVRFRHGVQVGDRILLASRKPLIKNVGRRTVLSLPPRMAMALTGLYFRTQHATTFDWFKPLGDEDMAFATRAIQEFKPDHLFLDTIRLSPLLEGANGRFAGTRHLIMHDLVSARVESLGQLTSEMPDYEAAVLSKYREEKDALQAEELRRLSLFDVILAIQATEAAYVASRLPNKQTLYVPMPATASERPIASADLRHRTLFVGSKGEGNMQGIRWFMAQVWPKVRARVPNAELDICGSCCSFIETTDASVKLHGRVDDLRHYYAQADACIVPLLGGSGMKIKLVEALATGAACVATTVGMQGLETGANDAFLHADTADAFAAAVTSLMTDRSTRDRVRGRAITYVKNHLSPELVFSDLRQVLEGRAVPNVLLNSALWSAS